MRNLAAALGSAVRGANGCSLLKCAFLCKLKLKAKMQRLIVRCSAWQAVSKGKE